MGATTDSKSGIASAARLLLYDRSASRRRSFGRRVAMSAWSRAPQEWPTPTTISGNHVMGAGLVRLTVAVAAKVANEQRTKMGGPIRNLTPSRQTKKSH